MRPMRLLFVSRSIPLHRLGGMEIVAWDLACELVRRGHSVEFLTTPIKSLPPYTKRDGVGIRTVPGTSGRYSLKWWRGVRDIYRDSYAANIDLTLGIGLGGHPIVDAERESPSGTPVVIQSHGTPWSEILSKVASPTLRSLAGIAPNLHHLLRDIRLRYYSHIIAIGPAVQKHMSAIPMRWLKSRTALTVIENGINDASFHFNQQTRLKLRSSLGIPASAKTVISVSRLISQKGCQRAMTAMLKAMTVNNDLHYIVAGIGASLEELRNMVEKAGMSSRVHFVGAIARAVLNDYLSAADIFLFTTLRQEGLAIAPLEAAANGLHCILSRHVVPPELNCTPVNPANVEEIVAAVHASLEAKRSEKSLLPHRYTLGYSADLYEQVFDDLITRSKSQ